MYFQSCETVAAVKSLFRKLAMQHHPDRGGDTRTMQDIVAEYHQALQRKDGEVTFGADNREHKYTYRKSTENAVLNKVMELLGLRLPGVSVDVIGTWIWVTGDTKPNKDKLKDAKLRWHSKRQCWYWKPYPTRHRYASKYSLSDLAMIYGHKHFEQNEQAVVA